MAMWLMSLAGVLFIVLSFCLAVDLQTAINIHIPPELLRYVSPAVFGLFAFGILFLVIADRFQKLNRKVRRLTGEVNESKHKEMQAVE